MLLDRCSPVLTPVLVCATVTSIPELAYGRLNATPDRLHDLLRHRSRTSQGEHRLRLGHLGDALFGLLARALLHLSVVDGVVDGFGGLDLDLWIR